MSELTMPRAEEELDNIDLLHRRDSATEVFLMWHRTSNVLSIFLSDLTNNRGYNFVVPNDKGLDAFEHPWVYNGEPLGEN
jgi:hypothetical protein